mmetsp:Transcript_33690/g.93037  ORF Transcript_33690/g.93037 Transcript_33690/m.93037 type:complete len:218 (-) Transcript_33690:3052-3705(-)
MRKLLQFNRGALVHLHPAEDLAQVRREGALHAHRPSAWQHEFKGTLVQERAPAKAVVFHLLHRGLEVHVVTDQAADRKTHGTPQLGEVHPDLVRPARDNLHPQERVAPQRAIDPALQDLDRLVMGLGRESCILVDQSSWGSPATSFPTLRRWQQAPCQFATGPVWGQSSMHQRVVLLVPPLPFELRHQLLVGVAPRAYHHWSARLDIEAMDEAGLET